MIASMAGAGPTATPIQHEDSDMMFGQYGRIEAKAGGFRCSDRAFIRAALRAIKKRSRYARKSRNARHLWLLQGLEIKHKMEATWT